MPTRALRVLAVCALLTLEGCASFAHLRPRRAPPAEIAPHQAQVEQRAYQTRAFDTTEDEQMLRVVIATLQDLGFVIDQASPSLGLVSASRTGRSHAMRMTVTVRPLAERRLLVRANAQTPRGAPIDGWRYQAFFAALEKAMFLKAHEVD